VLVVGDFARKAGITEAALKDLAPRARLMRTVLKSEIQHLLSTTPIDLILAVSGAPLGTEDLKRAMNSLPIPIPILVLSQSREQTTPSRPGEVIEHILAPVEILELRARIDALLATRTQLIRIEGVSLAGFVQIIEMERRTCTLFVASEERRGVLRFIDGSLVDARSPTREGDAAALEIFGWPTSIFAIHRVVSAPPVATIHRSLTHLLLDAARLGDNAGRNLARITARAPAANDLDFSEELSEAPANLSATLSAGRQPATVAEPLPVPSALVAAAAPLPPDEPGPTPPAKPPPARAMSPTRPPLATADALMNANPITANTREIGEKLMANINKTIEEAMKIDGAIGVALADYESGLCLGSGGGGSRLNIEVAAAGNCQVVKAKMNTMQELGIRGAIHDILITLEDQIHLVRPLRKYENLFIYLAIDKVKGNLGMARHRLQKIETDLIL
jgi:hypothetical protein